MFQKEAEEIYKLFARSNLFLENKSGFEKPILKPITNDQMQLMKRRTQRRMLIKNANRFIKP
jgi:hypothetical protein